MTHHRTRRFLSVAAAVAVIATGCGGEAPDTTGGPGLPQRREGETYPGNRREITGRFVLADNGCFLLRGDGTKRFVVWPADATHGGDKVLLGDGTSVAAGDRLTGVGTLLPVTRLADWPGGYWGNTVSFCLRKPKDVVVFDSVEVAKEP